MTKINLFNYNDAPETLGLFLQDNFSPQMEGLEELHNNIMFYLAIILFAVSWIMLSIILNYRYAKIIKDINLKKELLESIKTFLIILVFAVLCWLYLSYINVISFFPDYIFFSDSDTEMTDVNVVPDNVVDPATITTGGGGDDDENGVNATLHLNGGPDAEQLAQLDEMIKLVAQDQGYTLEGANNTAGIRIPASISTQVSSDCGSCGSIMEQINQESTLHQHSTCGHVDMGTVSCHHCVEADNPEFNFRGNSNQNSDSSSSSDTDNN